MAAGWLKSCFVRVGPMFGQADLRGMDWEILTVLRFQGYPVAINKVFNTVMALPPLHTLAA